MFVAEVDEWTETATAAATKGLQFKAVVFHTGGDRGRGGVVRSDEAIQAGEARAERTCGIKI